MYKSAAGVALRHLTNRKLESAFNILGLAIGLASCLLITLFVRYELSYESGFANAERIFRVSRDYQARDGARARVPAPANAPIGPAIAADFPAVAAAARLFGGSVQLARDDRRFSESAVRFADNALFDVFDFQWLRGTPEQALTEPFTIVLTESLASRYFGQDDPLGQTLTVDNAAPLRVTGVIADLPDNTHLVLDGVISLPTLVAAFGPQMLEQWHNYTDFHTYLLLHESADVAALEAGLPAFMDRHFGAEAAAASGLTLMNIRDVHLDSTRDEEWQTPGSRAAVYGFAAVALGILLIACINFMNLSTARATQRAREVAMRKAVGATRGQLVAQFLGESTLLALLAMLLAVSLVELLLPPFSAFVGATLAFDYLRDPALIAMLLGLTALVGVVAGSYPAFYLSAFDPARVLKGELTRGRGGVLFRNLLVVLQFAIAIALLICLAVVYQQTTLARTMDLGFDKSRIVVLSGSARAGLGDQWPAFREELADHPGIEAVTASHYTPFMFDDNRLAVGQPGQQSFSRIQFMGVDYDFFSTYDIELLAGRTFNPAFAGDALSSTVAPEAAAGAGVVLNRTAARLLGWTPEAAAGEPVEVGFGEDAGLRAVVAGVVADTHFESVRVPVRPMIYVLVPSLRMGENFRIRHASVRLAPGDPASALAHIDDTWRTFLPDQPVARRFLDLDFEALYQRERRQEVLLALFAGLAVFIACVGLFGLAAFNAERRTKEIGVRKALGGSMASIVVLLTSDFSRLVLAANLLAWPAGYLIMRNWLDNFAYRVDLSPLLFVAASLAALAVAWLAVAGIAARAAAADPVRALRYE